MNPHVKECAAGSLAATTPAYSVRLASANDVPAIVAISNEAARTTAANFAIEPESLESWMQSWRDTHEQFPWLVAVDGAGQVIGFAKASPWKGRCAYRWTAETSVYIAPQWHRRGVGRSLYSVLFELLKAQRFHSAIAGITQPNPASERLHESFGMQHVGTFQQVGWKFNAWHDVGYWMIVFPLAGEPQPLLPVSAVSQVIKPHQAGG